MSSESTETTPAPRQRLPAAALDQLFRDARTYTAWCPELVPTALLTELYDLLKFAPTSANCSPARFVFLTTPEAKARLEPALARGNVVQTMTAPVTVIIAWDNQFFTQVSRLYPRGKMAETFAADPALAAETAFRNGSLEGAYLILAARALGLDCGPMSGFDKAKLNAEFFPDGQWQANFLCNLGYGDPVKLHPRDPRLDFDAACHIL
jgi:3-hydroxypropanoate dehydrogenase